MNTFLIGLMAEGGVEEIGQVTGSDVDKIFAGGQKMLTYAGQVLNVVCDNPVLVIPLAVSFTYMAIGLFKALKKR